MSEAEVIELTKKFFPHITPEIYFTNGGSVVVIFTKTAGGERPWLGAYFTGECWLSQQWDSAGRIFEDEPRKLDLILPMEQNQPSVA